MKNDRIEKIIVGFAAILTMIFSTTSLASAGVFTNLYNRVSGQDVGATINSLPYWRTIDSDTIVPRNSLWELGDSSNRINYGYFNTIDASSYVGISQDHSALSNLLWSAAGHTIDTDVDFDDNGIENLSHIQFDLTNTETAAEGKLYWNDDDGTLNLGLKGGNVNLQIGQEHVLRAKNETGSQINNGSVAYISGATGAVSLLSLADADDESAHKLIGVATENIANSQFGYVTTSGLVRDINTFHLDEGEIVFLSQTAGGTTSTAPSNPANVVRVGICLRSHATEGVLLVDPDASYDHIDELTDVAITSVGDDELLSYDAVSGMWINKTASEAGLATASEVDSLSSEVTQNRQNTVLNAWNIAIQNALTVENMVNGFQDVYTDETGINTTASINELYNSSGDYYSRTSPPDWYDTDWSHRTEITIDADEIDTDVVNEAVLIDLSNMSSDFWDNVESDGSDILPVIENTLDEEYELQFDGVNDKVTVPDDDALSPANAITIMFWAYDSDPKGNYLSPISKYSTGNLEWDIIHYVQTGTYQFYVRGGSTPHIESTYEHQIQKNVWEHWAFQYDDTSGDMYIYKNGALVASKSETTGALANTGSNITIGARDASLYFKGKLKDVRIYDSIIADTDIATIYSAGTDPQPSNLIGRWELDEGTGTTATDTSTNGNDGTISGATWIDDNSYELPRELLNFSVANETGQLWVKVPEISSSTDTSFNLYFGNSGATETNSVDTWGDHYREVWHLEESSGSAYDSTGVYTGTYGGSLPNQTAVKIDNGQSLDGEGDYISHGGAGVLSSNITFEFWATIDSSQPDASSRSHFFYGSTNRISMERYHPYSSPTPNLNIVDTSYRSFAYHFPTDTLKHVTVTYNRTSGTYKLYIDGAFVDDVAGATGRDWNGTRAIGANNSGANEMAGDFDEFRVSAKERSADEVATIYNIQNAPNTVISIGTVEEFGMHNLTLVSASVTAEAQPDTVYIQIQQNDAESITLNTDLIAYVSRDGGTTYSSATLSDLGDFGSTRILYGEVDVSGQPSGTSMVYKIRTANSKDTQVHATAILWQ